MGNGYGYGKSLFPKEIAIVIIVAVVFAGVVAIFGSYQWPASSAPVLTLETVAGVEINTADFSTPSNPLEVHDGSWFTYDLRGAGASNIACIDGLGKNHLLNNKCDADEVLPVGYMAGNIYGSWFSSNELCSTTMEGKTQCPFRYWVNDNSNSNVLYVKIGTT